MGSGRGMTPDINEYAEVLERASWPADVRSCYSLWRDLCNHEPRRGYCQMVEQRLDSRTMWVIADLWSAVVKNAYGRYVAACKRHGMTPAPEEAKR